MDLDRMLLPSNAGTSDFLLNTLDIAPSTLPKRPGAYLRISDDQSGEERGVGRQEVDTELLRERLGWAPFVKLYPENDTGAWRKRKIQLPDGRIEFRVIRPLYRQMLDDLMSGEIDGAIVYDLDRLARQNRDLEDLIDIVEYRKVPVQGVGHIDLMTSGGRLTARLVVAMANKASEDTSRRVTRAAIDDARRGKVVRGGPRRYGWEKDGQTVIPREAAIIRELVQRVMDGEAVSLLARDLQDRGVSTAGGVKWTRTTVQTVLRAPRLAGIRAYSGRAQPGKPPKINEWWRRATRVNGEYVRGDWQAILEIDEWLALQGVLDGSNKRRSDAAIERPGARKYLLSGLCFCGTDGCGARMVGRMSNGRTAYACKPRDLGGCNKVSRNQSKVDDRVLWLLKEALSEDQVKGQSAPRRVGPTPDTVENIEKRKESARQRWASGLLPDDDYWAALEELNARAATITGAIELQARIRALPSRATTIAELDSPEVPIARKRGIVETYIERVIIKPSSRGPHFNPRDIHIVWRET